MDSTSVQRGSDAPEPENGRERKLRPNISTSKVHELLENQHQDSLSLEQIFGTLSNDRRRFVLRYLEVNDEPVTIGELAEAIAAVENETTVDAVSSEERKRVYVALHQCHLPKMDSLGVIGFNKSRGTIETGQNAQAVMQSLKRVTGQSENDTFRYPSLSPFFLELAATSVFILTFGYSFVNAFPAPDPLLAALAVFGIFSSLYLWAEQKKEYTQSR